MIDGMDKLAEYCEAFYALSEADKRCNCENTKCEKAKHHIAGDCKKKAGGKKVMYLGSICDECAKGYDPEDFKKEAAKKEEDFVFSPEKSKDKKGHFPLSNAGQARNALARSHQYSSVPPWYSGSLSSLQAAVRRAVKAKFPSIEVSEPKKKKSSLEEVANGLLMKNAQQAPTAQPVAAPVPAPAPAPAAKPVAPNNQSTDKLFKDLEQQRNQFTDQQFKNLEQMRQEVAKNKPAAPTAATPAVAKPVPAKPTAPKGKLTDQQYQEMINNITQNLTPQQQQNLKQIETQGTASAFRGKVAQQAPAAQPAATVPAPAKPAVVPAKPAPAKPAPAKPAAPKGKLTDQQYQEMIKNITQNLTPQQQQNLKQIETQGSNKSFNQLAQTLAAKNAQQAPAEKVHPNKVQTSDAFNDLLPLPTNTAPAPQAAPLPAAPAKGQGIGKFDRKPQSNALPPPPAPSPKDHGKFRSGKFSQLAEALLSKNAQMAAAAPQAQMQALQAKMDAALQPFGYALVPDTLQVSPAEKVVDVKVSALPHAKFPQGSQTGELRKILAPLVPGMAINPTVLFS
jgi:hypothetical protein